MSLEHEVSRIADALFAIAERMRPRLPTPGPITVTPISERRVNDMDFITYRANFPAVPAGTDIASQLFDVAVDGADQPQQTLGKDATSADFEVPQGSSVALRLIYVDDAGNHSQPSTQSFVAVDTIAPDAPGAFGEITAISERTVPDA